METFLLLRYTLALILASYLSFHGISKKSLDLSGALGAILVGFLSFACSYRFGFILILFYYSSSKLTKFKENVKSLIEDNYAKGGQRNYLQVFASSLLATAVAVVFYICCGEDSDVNFGNPPENDEYIEIFNVFTITQSTLKSYLWSVYIAHYATATADTWASELGVLSKSKPRLVTSLFLRAVPPGTNGGMSIVGTSASAAGGLFIGLIFWVGSYTLSSTSINESSQFPMVVLGLVCGVLGSLVDSLLGATLQATYYSVERKCIVKSGHKLKDDLKESVTDNSVIRICGVDILSNEAVNLLSIFLTMVLAVWIAPNVFCALDSTQCFEAIRLNQSIEKLFSNVLILFGRND
jgi:uncharacterized membrane protein